MEGSKQEWTVHSKVVSTQKLPLKWPIKPFYSTWFNVEMFHASFSPLDTKYAKILQPYLLDFYSMEIHNKCQHRHNVNTQLVHKVLTQGRETRILPNDY